MSKHWRPGDKIVPIGAARVRRDWARASSYGVPAARRKLPAGAKAGLMLVAAACLGTGVGLYQVAGPRASFEPDAPIEWNAVQSVPTRVPEGADTAWQQRANESGGAHESDATQAGLPRRDAARNNAVRAHFGQCHSGGGTNCVVDGDTFYVGGAKVRIAGIDAPETHPPRCAEEAQLGEAATGKLRALLNSGAVTLTGIGRDRDGYGRLLRDVAVDGADVGEAMVGAGVAREYGSGRRAWC